MKFFLVLHFNIKISVISILFLFTNCAGPKNVTLTHYKKSHFNLYSVADDIKMGEVYLKQHLKQLKKKNIPFDDEKNIELKKRVERIMNRLKPKVDLSILPFEVHVIDKPDVSNAFCMPGGKMAVYTGLLDAKKGLVDVKSDDELAAVMAHEMAHATMRHVTRTLTGLQGASLLGGLLSAVVGDRFGEDWQDIANQAFYVGALMVMPKYSRQHELEADRVGLYYMTKAGYDPQAAVKVWQRAARKAKEKGQDHTQFFDSHPASGERAKALEAFLPQAFAVQEQQNILAEMRKP